MSFAYIEGQEAQALAFFEKLLEQCADVEKRKDLEIFVEKLRAKVKETNPPASSASKEGFSWNSSLSLAAAK
jgi:hypothetical protein